MTILDLINKSAIMLNVQEVITNKIDISTTNEKDILDSNFALKRLFEFSKMVINEINLHFPNEVEVECQAVNGCISLDSFERLTKVVSVRDRFGYIKYSQVNNTIKVVKDGTYWITFKQGPQINSLLSEIEICVDVVSEDVLVCGLNSYYCLAVGLFEEFNMYHQQYTEKLNKIKNLKVFTMPCRSWE